MSKDDMIMVALFVLTLFTCLNAWELAQQINRLDKLEQITGVKP